MWVLSSWVAASRAVMPLRPPPALALRPRPLLFRSASIGSSPMHPRLSHRLGVLGPPGSR